MNDPRIDGPVDWQDKPIEKAATIVPPRQNGARAATLRCAICIATYHRPLGLTRVIRSLERLDVTSCDGLSFEVIVVDNDPEASASTLCARLSQGCRWPITYFCEPRRGIPFARNAVVRAALSRGADYLAFLDDDAEPETTWLNEAWKTMTRTGADIVTGPSVPRFEAPVARWLLTGGLYDDQKRATGTQLTTAHAGNILMRVDVFQRTGRFFDEKFCLSGGEDTDFFRHTALAGCTIVWTNDAIVREWIPKSRTRVRWLLSRAYRWGIVWAQLDYDRAAYCRVAMRGLAKGALWLPWSLFQGRASAVRASQLIAAGIGYLAGRAGFRFEEYRLTHGD